MTGRFGRAAPPSSRAHYVDPATGERFPLDAPLWRSPAGRPLLISPGPGIDSSDIDTTERSLWRYRAALPLSIDDPKSLGEGCTPLVQRTWSGSSAYFKLEWFSPTGSFKDRGASVMLSALRQQGVTSVLEDSSGNGGAAVACYAAAGGLEATVFAPASTSPAKLVQSRAYGARVELVDGPREASQAAAIAAAEVGAGFYASHNWQAFFLEGTKTLAYEIWEDLGFRAPDNVVLPVGAGSSLLGCAFGFDELLRAGAIERLPRLFAAQPLNCSPVDAAFHVEPRPLELGSGTEPPRMAGRGRPVRPTIAEGTAIRNPLRLTEILTTLRESGGATVAVTEQQIAEAHAGLASMGMYAEPTSAVAAAGLELLLASGTINPGETTVVVLTGSGLKAPRAAG